MHRSRLSPWRSRLSLLGILVALLVPGRAAAEQDQCPPGSTWKTKEGAGWCEPSVCDSDAQCLGGEICRLVPLCIEIGKIDPKTPGDGGALLMARQKCGENKSCPSSTVCSDKSRCLSRAQAEKMGLLSATPGASASAGPGAAAPAKKACGCDVPGASAGDIGAAFAALTAALTIVTRRRARRKRASSDRM